MGIILSISLLIAPGAIAVLVTTRFHVALLVAVMVSMLVCVSGVYLSFYLDSAPAPTIVVLFALVFIITFAVTSVNAKRRENMTAG
ncbi:Manganese transport system membrane protein MntB [compost metagenome]